MKVLALDHVNIHTADLAKTVRFYEDIIGLEARPTRNKPATERVWLYDAHGRAVIHLNLLGSDTTVERLVTPGAPTGAIHHIAFECENYDGFMARLSERGLGYYVSKVTEIGLRQLFVSDPNSVLLELNFRGS